MQLTILPLDAAVGHLLCHNLADEQGHKAFAKGHRLAAADLPRLRELGHTHVRVAILDADDLHENAAAQRFAAALAGPNVTASAAHTGRVNLKAALSGPLYVDVATLSAINELDGLTAATLPQHTLVKAGSIIATLKVIPFAVPQHLVACAEQLGQACGGILRVAELRLRRIAVMLVSSAAAQRRVERGLYPAIHGRVSDLGAEVIALRHVGLAAEEVAAALTTMGDAEAIIIAGETSIIDINDLIPEGIRQAGGQIAHYGAPVEPGNLLLLAYLGGRPVLGAPGCVRSRDRNIVDLILPRLLAGEQLGRREIVALGHGGLL